MAVINSKWFIHFIFISLVIFFTASTLVSCKSRKAVCDANRSNKTLKIKKNRNQYKVRYDFKSKPVRKDYVIRNGR